MKKSTISAIAAVSAAGVVALSLGAVTDWYKNWDGSTWFNYWGKGAPTIEEPVTPDTPDDPNTPDDPSTDKDTDTKDGAIVTEGDNNGIAIKTAKLPRAAYAANGVSAQADTAYIITATVEPEEATNKSVTFTAAWANADSAWATDKTVSDYVTVTASDNIATVECKQAFGEQIVITCRSRDNSAIYSTCTVDYMKKVTSSKFTGYCVDDMSKGGFTLSTIGDRGHAYVGHLYSFDAVPTYSVGSLDDNIVTTIKFTPAHLEWLSGVTAHTVEVEDNTSFMFDGQFMDRLYGSGFYGTSAFYSYCSNCMTAEAIKVDVLYKGDTTEYEYTYWFRIHPDSVKVNATNVSLDHSNIIF